MHKFNRFLDRYDMLCKILIDVVDQRGLRGGFPRAGGTGHKDQAAAYIGKVFHHRRNPQLFEGGNPGGNQTKRCAVTVRLFEVVTAETRGFVHLIGKIQVSALFKGFPITRSADFAHHLDGFFP